jgi:hypothetical protein
MKRTILNRTLLIGDQVLSTKTSSPLVPFNPRLPSMDAIATLSQDSHTLYLAVINLSETDEMETTIRLKFLHTR